MGRAVPLSDSPILPRAQNPYGLSEKSVGLHLFSGTEIARLFLGGMISLKTGNELVTQTPNPDHRTAR